MKFKVGDRVRVYISRRPFVANVNEILPDGCLFIAANDGHTMAVLPKACRKLVKKKRREWWVDIYPNGVFGIFCSKEDADKWTNSDRLDCVLVREVIAKEKK